jgi:hypothetical protein
VRQRREEGKWEARGGEDEVCFFLIFLLFPLQSTFCLAL